MRRVLLASAAVLAVLVVLAVAVYAIRYRSGQKPAAQGEAPGQQPMAGMPTGGALPKASEPATTQRGNVTIDPRRQQLIGVRTAPVTREAMQHALRTVGTVRYDETSLVDVNLRLEGWIRDLYVDYTGQPIQKGQPLFTLYSPDLLATQQEYLLA